MAVRSKTGTAAQSGASPILDRTAMAPTSEPQPGATPLAIGCQWLKQQPEYIDAADA